MMKYYSFIQLCLKELNIYLFPSHGIIIATKYLVGVSTYNTLRNVIQFFYFPFDSFQANALIFHV
jgi:hypothetical protein